MLPHELLHLSRLRAYRWSLLWESHLDRSNPVLTIHQPTQDGLGGILFPSAATIAGAMMHALTKSLEHTASLIVFRQLM
jgi:hypothetical protein